MSQELARTRRFAINAPQGLQLWWMAKMLNSARWLTLAQSAISNLVAG